MKYLAFLFAFVMLISMTSAIDSLGTFKQYDTIRVAQVCQDATWINISSITSPNSSYIILNTPMVSSGNGEFYINFTQTAQVGRYNVRGISNGCEKTFAFYFEITPTGGPEDNLTMFLILIFASIITLLLGFIFKNYAFSTISGFAFAATGVYVMINGFADITSFYTRVISFISLGLGVIITVISIWELVEESYGGEKSESDED